MDELWYNRPSREERATAAAEVCHHLWSQTSQQRQRARRQIERYYGASLDPEMWRMRYQIADDLPLVWNLTRSLVGTVQNRIGAVGNPKLQFVTSDATWSVRRRGQKLDQFVDALALQDCGQYSTVHELRSILLRDACLFGVSWCQVDADLDMGRVVTERCFPWEVMTDSRDSRYGQPQQWVRTFTVSKRNLIAWYPEYKDQIELASETSDIELEVELGLAQRTTPVKQDIVRCYHLWQLASGPDSPGRHMLLLDDGSVPLVDEDWDLEMPPLIGMWWDKPLIGLASMSLADEVSASEDEINRNLQRCADSVRRTGLATILCPNDAVDEKDLENTRDATIIKFKGAVTPQMFQALPFEQAHIQWLELLFGKIHDLTGVSQMAAHAEKDPGITAAAAIRAVASLQSERFADLTRAQDNWMIRWAELAIHAVARIAEENKDFTVKWSGKEFLRTINWKDVSLARDEYVMQIRPVGGSKNEPADRMQRAEELVGAGYISQQAYMAIVATTLDVQAATDRQTKQSELLDVYIDRWLDATDEQLETGMFNEKKQILLVPPPLKWLNLPDAILQVAQAYMRAEIDEAPDEIRQLFIQWLEMADAQLEQQAASKQAANTALASAGQAAVANPQMAAQMAEQMGPQPQAA